MWFPRLPTDRLRRLACGAHKTDTRDAPLVVAGRTNNALYVYALNRRAQQLGLHPGQPLANARAMVENLPVVPADEKADLALLESIADWCDRFTPLVSVDAPDGLLLDITGVAHLFGGEAAMLRHVREKIAPQGFAVQAAIAGTSLCARALARYAGGTIASPGEDRAAIAPLPIAALDCGEDRLRALKRAGLKTIAQVAERGRAELTARLGIAFLTRLHVMLGAEEKPLAPRRPLPDLSAAQHFAEPVTTQDVIAKSLHDLSKAVSDILERQGQGLRLLEAVFFRADGKVQRIAIRTGAPLRDPDVILRLLNQRLDALADPLDPGFGFDLIRLEARIAEETHPAEASFDADENTRRQIAYLADRLSARFGEHRVQRFVPQDTHIPEAQSVAVPAQDRDFDGAWTRKRREQDPPLRPLRMLDKPEEIHGVLATVPDGPPPRFRWRKAWFQVIRAEGPERIAMDWWRKQNPTRDYYRVETEDGQRFWLYRDGLFRELGLATRWYLQGIFA